MHQAPVIHATLSARVALRPAGSPVLAGRRDLNATAPWLAWRAEGVTDMEGTATQRHVTLVAKALADVASCAQLHGTRRYDGAWRVLQHGLGIPD